MLNPFVCGTFNHEDDELCSSSPSKYKRKDSKNNPYSTRGLDKFSQLLSDLNEKRQKIYSQMNPHDISFVRFVHSNTDDFVPIIVKVKNKDHKNKSQDLKVVKVRNLTMNSESTEKSTDQSSSIMEERNQPKMEINRKATKKNISWIINKLDMEKPMFYLPFIVIMILVLLTLFGRTAATIFTCILWYVIPTLKDLNSRNSMKKRVVVNNEGVKKKDYVRGFSEKKIVVNEGAVKKKDFVRRWSEKKMVTNDGLFSPRSGDSDEANKNKIQGKHSHKKSW
ncbi:uncharacterized protein [Cicer arietinum]|uniref:Uncharacterized protein LOC101511983 n=1 Tax=Cicer arietinum TaxID=3827 RepID=A0A1S2Y569_CICAR|nr:uncharacterized protein LOC101511983 [Cicer arietinum]